MNRVISFLRQKARKIRDGDWDDWNCAREGDDLVISPKTHFTVACICGSAFIGGAFIAGAILLPDHPETTLYHRLGFLVFGAAVASLGPISTYFGAGEWRLNSRAIEFHYFYRRKDRPIVFHWKDVQRLRMMGNGWAFRGKDSKAFIPFQHISPVRQRQVNVFLEEILSPHFDLRTKPIPGKKVFQFVVAPVIGILVIMTCAIAFVRLYLTYPVFQPIIPPIVVVCLLGLWSLIVIGLFVTHGIILHRQATKDNPWRYRQEDEAAMIHEQQTVNT